MYTSRVNPHAPIIDGKLDDDVWRSRDIRFGTGFLQMDPDEGKPATESTLVASVYDDGAIYFAFWCYDSEPDKVKRQLVRRDRSAEADLVRVELDPYHDHQTGYEFILNASGVQRDFRLYDDVNSDLSWDGIWEGAVARQPWGWSAEFKIPFHNLRFTRKDEHIWGINVTRYISRKTESDWWAFSPSTEGGVVSRFGHLEGLSGIDPPRQLEALPYAVSKLETQFGERETFGDLGFDLKYGLSSNLILNATINPDFGQVELDQPVLNLSPFETFFDERRPFFLEGADIFSTRFMLLNTRRIGRAVSGSVDDGAFAEYADYPETATILGAAKITGKLAGGTTVGFLNAVAAEESADYLDTLGLEHRGVVEPGANFTVLRLKQDILTNSNVGILLAHVSQDQYHPATTGGLDWQLYTKDGVWGFGGQTVFSRVDNKNVGFGLAAEIFKAAGKHWRGSISTTIKDPHLQINRLGYTSRNDFRYGSIWIQYRTQDDWWIVRNSWNNLNGWVAWNYAGANVDKGGNFNTSIEFTNYWTLSGGFNEDFTDYSDWETRGNGLWVFPRAWSWWASLNTDPRKKVSLNLNPGSGHERYGSWWAHYTGISYRPAANMEYELGVNVIKTNGETRWVDNPEDSVTNERIPLFADLDQTEVTIYASAGITFTRNLSAQLSANGLMSGLDYEDYRQYLGNERYGPFGAIEAPNSDYNYSSLNSTLLIRWEYLPGSTLYIVWTRSRPETDKTVNDFDFSRDFDRFFSSGAKNIFLVKASYWLNI